MLATNIPYKFAEPWGAAAAPSFINKPIPVVSASGVVASQALGFPPATSLDLAAGGTPPNIADFNGMMHYVTSWAQWLQAGGPIFYDADFVSTIGGYPKGANLNSQTRPGAVWTSLVDNNTTNPDAGGSNWTNIANLPWAWTVTQTFNAGAQFINYDSVGFNLKFVSTTYSVGFRNDNANFYLLMTPTGSPNGTWSNLRPLTVNLANGQVTLDGTGAGVVTGGNAQVNGNLAVLGSEQISGGLAVGGAMAVNGTVTAQGALRVGQGAKGTGDGNRAVILSDFGFVASATNNSWAVSPDGVIDQVVQGLAIGVQGSTVGNNFVLPVTFPTRITDAICCFGGTNPPSGVGLCCTPLNNSIVLVTTTVSGTPGPGTGSFNVVVRARGN